MLHKTSNDLPEDIRKRAIDEAGAFGDADTADLFTQISREMDKNLWLVEAHSHVDR